MPRMNEPIEATSVPEPEVEEALTGPGVGPDVHAAGLTLQPDDVHRPEREVHADDHQPEVPLADHVSSSILPKIFGHQ